MVDAATWDGVLVRYGQAMVAAQGMERASPFQVDIFDCIASPEDARLLRDLDHLEQSALGQAYNEDVGDFDVPLPHPFDDSSTTWD
jgi:hypothetical protein